MKHRVHTPPMRRLTITPERIKVALSKEDKDTLDAGYSVVGIIHGKARRPYSQDRHIALLERGFKVFRRDVDKIIFVRESPAIMITVTLFFGEKE